jgi:ribosomal protein S18 acetylase RimI-like enzyme
VIRPARLEDAEAIARVHVATWRAAYGHAVPSEMLAAVDVGERAELWKGWLAGPSATFVGEVGDEVCGFVNVGASVDHPGEGELFSIYVLPTAWGTGLATALIDAGEEELRTRGFTRARLNVLADNPRARRFYERQGWARGETFQSTFLGHEVELARHRKDLSMTAGV